jgi:hypothetical protein
MPFIVRYHKLMILVLPNIVASRKKTKEAFVLIAALTNSVLPNNRDPDWAALQCST